MSRLWCFTVAAPMTKLLRHVSSVISQWIHCAALTTGYSYVKHSPSMLCVAAPPSTIICGRFKSAGPQKRFLSAWTACKVDQIAMCWSECSCLAKLTICLADNGKLQIILFAVTLLKREESTLHGLWFPGIQSAMTKKFGFRVWNVLA